MVCTRHLGAFIRWLFTGCKNNLSDEVHGRLEPRWLKFQDTENDIIGLITCIVIVTIGVIVVNKRGL